MKLTEAKCRVTGVQLGEAQLNFIRSDLVPIQAKIALLAEDGTVCGYFEKRNGWSEKTHVALQALADALEEDALVHLFQQPEAEAAPDAEKAEEPQQF